MKDQKYFHWSILNEAGTGWSPYSRKQPIKCNLLFPLPVYVVGQMVPSAFTWCLPEIPSNFNRLNMLLFRKRTTMFLPNGEMRKLKS